jgi:type II secretory ATPase GspE/PulE/Tfp pilus assembly ATPase PilB-like protein
MSNNSNYFKNLEDQLAKESDISAVKVLNSLVKSAYDLKASDIHIDPMEEGLKIRFRIDGVLQEIATLPQKINLEVISRIKIICGLRTDEHQATQDGRFSNRMENGNMIDVRVSIAPTHHGENAVLRLLSDTLQDFTLETLGFDEKEISLIKKALHKPWGMILATGPTGSGKTTTIYSLIKLLNKIERSIITVEDPIEYEIKGITQIQVNTRTDLTFANGLRAILRQDPNIIMIGEIRDFETASLAINTALTGHLFLSSIHTTDSATSIVRLLDMKIEPFLIASTVNLVIAQRLVRKICDKCKVSYKMTKAEHDSLLESIPAKFLKDVDNLYRGQGCPECNQTGYKGRISINEVLVTNDAIREAILKRSSSSQIREVAIAEGMTTMLEEGFQKVRKGVTTAEEILRVINE